MVVPVQKDRPVAAASAQGGLTDEERRVPQKVQVLPK